MSSFDCSTKPYHKKRPHVESDTDSESDNTQVKPFPRFLIIQSTDENKKIASLSPFVIDKQISSIVGKAKQIKILRNGNLLIEITTRQQANNLLSQTTFFQIPCRVFPHKSLNTSRGVIRCPDLRTCSDDEITNELKSENVIAARRMKLKKKW